MLHHTLISPSEPLHFPHLPERCRARLRPGLRKDTTPEVISEEVGTQCQSKLPWLHEYRPACVISCGSSEIRPYWRGALRRNSSSPPFPSCPNSGYFLLLARIKWSMIACVPLNLQRLHKLIAAAVVGTQESRAIAVVVPLAPGRNVDVQDRRW